MNSHQDRPASSRPSSSSYGSFQRRHIGSGQQSVQDMATALGFANVEEFLDAAIPSILRQSHPLDLTIPAQPRGAAPEYSTNNRGLTEEAALAVLKEYANENQVWKSYIGTGYHGCHTPLVILRNILENPGWYTQYTPYQPEIAQGRLEALLNYQTMVCDLTGLPVANASLLDEATAAAEAMAVCVAKARARAGRSCQNDRIYFHVSSQCHPQVVSVVRTRGQALGIQLVVSTCTPESFADYDAATIKQGGAVLAGALLPYPTTLGEVTDISPQIAAVKAQGAIAVVAADILALTVLTPPGELGAQIVVGNTQRFGVPMGYGGPHAAFFACSDEFKRLLPGRIVGVSKDAQGSRALRLALQTREQHIRREKATSNICTAQVLLAVISSMYAVYHGPQGLTEIAHRVHGFACRLARGLKKARHTVLTESFFDTVTFTPSDDDGATFADIERAAHDHQVNLRYLADGTVSIAFDETVTETDFAQLCGILGIEALGAATSSIVAECRRSSAFMTSDVFHLYRSESDFLRYVKRLEAKDLSLCHSMIALGSCTMKLNATAEMVPVTWPEFGALHPFAPLGQTKGYQRLFSDLESWLAEITGFSGVSLQPNAGSQGEFAGLLVIRAYHDSRGDTQRNVCLIPQSAHGTNPASAVMAGFKVVGVACDKEGNVDIADLHAKVAQHAEHLGALMVTYPSTHGVFEEKIRDITTAVHNAGGQVYLDGANLNALVGLVSPLELGMDVCHMNLHKTFCIPHGGGGPGVGPIGVASHLVPFLPGHPLVDPARGSATHQIGAVSAAPWGSASILPISWMYIAMMGGQGLTNATTVAILHANYVAHQLRDHYPVLYRNPAGYVAHECIIDCRGLKDSAGVEVVDIARRLMDYGFHAPTISWPVPGTMMIEPTESESMHELQRFCAAMISIRQEIQDIEHGTYDKTRNPLKGAPHTARSIASAQWEEDYPYSRETAAFPASWVQDSKFWPATGAIDAAYGDRNLVCSCEPMEGDYYSAGQDSADKSAADATSTAKGSSGGVLPSVAA